MTDSIRPQSAIGPRHDHYDYETGECTVEPALSRTASARKAVTPQNGPQPPQAAVDQLVAAHTRSACWGERVLATTTCAGAVAAALSATTGVGVVLALSAGAACGAKLADAEATCLEK